MSVNRENVTWPAADGTWNIGFWDYYEVEREDGSERDDEWDVEYRHDRFWWAASGAATPEAAYERFTASNANPGGTTIVRTREGNEAYVERLDALLVNYRTGATR